MSEVHTCGLTHHSLCFNCKRKASGLFDCWRGLQQGLDSSIRPLYTLGISPFSLKHKQKNLAAFLMPSQINLPVSSLLSHFVMGWLVMEMPLLKVLPSSATRFPPGDLIGPLLSLPFHVVFGVRSWQLHVMWHPFTSPQIQVWPSSHVQQLQWRQDSKVFKTPSVATNLCTPVWWSECSRCL